MKDRNKKSMQTSARVAAVATLLALALVAPTGAFAKEYTAARKAGRGLAAMTTGFLELPGNMVVETRRGGLGRGLTLGFVKGLGGIVVRELVGVYEFVSAPVAVPSGYRPLITPEFPWGYFDESREVVDNRQPDSVPRAEPRASVGPSPSNAWGAPALQARSGEAVPVTPTDL